MSNSSEAKCDYENYRVQAKLEYKLFSKYYRYCRKHNLNRSSGLKQLLSTHPDLQ